MNTLTGIGRGLGDAASALDEVGHSLAGLAVLPLIGSSVCPVADQLSRAASDTQAQAATTVEALHVLAVVVGAVVALVPIPLVVC